jgi:hypothetical protein
MIYNLLRALVKIETGRSCRRCSQPIGARDEFGMSEAVCPACRREDRHAASDLGKRAPARSLVAAKVPSLAGVLVFGEVRR